MKVQILSLFVIFASYIKAEVTFSNVEIHGYSMFVHVFKRKVQSAETLKEMLPEDKVFDKIEIKNNSIPVLYSNSISNIDLDELILENDNINKIEPGSFKNVPFLRKLVITKNSIQEIKVGVFNGLEINTLDLSKNGINSIESGAFDNMKDLLNIQVADNKLSVWDKNWFADTPLLTRVSFQNNQIDKLPQGAFKNLKGTKRFETVALTISIILSHNKIKTINSAAFEDLSEINNLWLDYNDLSSFDEKLLQGITQLNDLRLDHNQIECFHDDFAKIFIANTTHLDGNPWDCQCLNKIEKWVKENKKTVMMSYAEMTCSAERIRQKIDALNKRLKELKEDGSKETLEEFV